MAGTVVCNDTLVFNADEGSGWTGGTQDSNYAVEGTYCRALIVGTTPVTMYYDKWGSGQDITGSHLRVYVYVSTLGILDTLANGGIRIYVQDTSGNYGEWYVGGIDNYAGGWKCFIVDTDRSFDFTSGTPSKTSIRYVGATFKMATATHPGINNCYVETCYFGSAGLILHSGTSGSPATLEDLITAENTYYYGVISKINDVYFARAPITIGDSSGTNSTYFKDTNEVIVFEDQLVDSTLYEIKGVGNSTGTTEIYFGEKSGTQGISGCIIKAAGSQNFKLTFTDTNITKLGLYGSTISNHGDVSLLPSATDREAYNCNWVNGNGQVSPNTMIFKNHFFISNTDTGGALLFPSDDSNVSDLTFINCSNGVEYGSGSDSTTPTLSNMVFDDVSGKYDVNNTSGGSVTLNNTGTSNANSYNPGGSSVTFQGSVTVKVTVKRKDTQAVIQDAQTSVWKLSDNSQIMNEDTDATGVAQETYTGTTPVDVVVKVRKSDDLDDPRFYPYSNLETVKSGTGLDIIVLLEVNPFV